MLKGINDPRHKSYIDYQSHVILFVRILATILHISSMRKITGEFDNENGIKNVATMLDIDDLEEMPHWGTINNYLEKHNESELESIIQKIPLNEIFQNLK